MSVAHPPKRDLFEQHLNILRKTGDSDAQFLIEMIDSLRADLSMWAALAENGTIVVRSA